MTHQLLKITSRCIYICVGFGCECYPYNVNALLQEADTHTSAKTVFVCVHYPNCCNFDLLFNLYDPLQCLMTYISQTTYYI